MSRGLGKLQRHFLQTLIELADETPDRWVRLQLLLERVLTRNAGWQRRWQQDQEESAQRRTDLETLARDGNSDAGLLLTLDDAIRSRPKEFRWFRRDHLPHWIESSINPSRVLQALERRDLIRRHTVPGWVLPTQAGRDFGATLSDTKCFQGDGETLRFREDVARRHPNAGFRTGCHVPFKRMRQRRCHVRPRNFFQFPWTRILQKYHRASVAAS
jgi:hypothetical protein